jgi:hypothetical protein
MKPSMRGLLSRGPTPWVQQDHGTPDNSFADALAKPGVLSGVVANVGWWQINPSPGVFVFDAIEAPLATVAAYNAKYPSAPLLVPLRVWCAQNAPDWVKAIGGAPLNIHENTSGKPLTIGRYWTPAYLAAYKALQTALAAKYDGNALIARVSHTGTASCSDEPWHTSVLAADIATLCGAGYTDAAMLAAQMDAPNWYRCWSTTPIEWDMQPHRATAAGKPVGNPDYNIPTQIMQNGRKILGSQIEFGNHGLSNPQAPQLAPIYSAMKTIGSPFAFQAQYPLVDWPGTVAQAAAMNASLELWTMPGHAQCWTSFPMATLLGWRKQLLG